MRAPSAPVPSAVLWRESAPRVDALPGFDRKRGHRVPDAVTTRATAFVRALAEPDVAAEVETCFAALRAQLGYKRRQLRVTLAPDGAAIATPDFEYHLVVAQDADDPGRARVRRTIQGVQRPDVLDTPAFAAVFEAGFDGLDLPVATRLDVAALIDDLEEREPPGWTLEYGVAATDLRLAHPQVPLGVHVTPERVRLAGERPLAAGPLLEAARAAVEAMGGVGDGLILAPE